MCQLLHHSKQTSGICRLQQAVQSTLPLHCTLRATWHPHHPVQCCRSSRTTTGQHQWTTKDLERRMALLVRSALHLDGVAPWLMPCILHALSGPVSDVLLPCHEIHLVRCNCTDCTICVCNVCAVRGSSYQVSGSCLLPSITCYIMATMLLSHCKLHATAGMFSCAELEIQQHDLKQEAS